MVIACIGSLLNVDTHAGLYSGRGRFYGRPVVVAPTPIYSGWSPGYYDYGPSRGEAIAAGVTAGFGNIIGASIAAKERKDDRRAFQAEREDRARRSHRRSRHQQQEQQELEQQAKQEQLKQTAKLAEENEKLKQQLAEQKSSQKNPTPNTTETGDQD